LNTGRYDMLGRVAIMDLVDQQLVSFLKEDAQQSSNVLAKKLHVSPATVRRRIKKLSQNGVVRIKAVVDYNKMGLNLAALFGFDVAHDKLDATMRALAGLPEVLWLSTTTGRYDIIAFARFTSTNELSNFLQREMASIDGVKESETFLCLQANEVYHDNVRVSLI